MVETELKGKMTIGNFTGPGQLLLGRELWECAIAREYSFLFVLILAFSFLNLGCFATAKRLFSLC